MKRNLRYITLTNVSSSATLGKYEKRTLLDARKNTSICFFGQGFFMHLISNGLDGVNINSLT